MTVFSVNATPSTISINDISRAEGNSGTATFDFTVSLSAAPGQTVTVNYATADGTATTADNDYVATSGALTFGPDDTSKTISVTVNGDTKFESNETFFVNLSNAVNATLPAGTKGTGTVQNDDTASPLSYSPSTQSLTGGAGGAAVSFTQIVTAPSQEYGAFNAAVQVTGTAPNPIPAAWVSTNPSSLSFTAPSSNQSKSWIVSFTVPAGTAAGTYTAQIIASPSTSGVALGPGSAVSLAVSACTAPSISSQPASAVACAGQSVTFSILQSTITTCRATRWLSHCPMVHRWSTL